jgi:hypothetical protein
MSDATAEAAARYAAVLDAREEQENRLRPRDPAADRWGGAMAQRFRQDPHRPLDASTAALADYVGPEDTVLDVGGGAGRIGLPLALRCRELINVEPSPGMCAQFDDVAAEAGISNARCLRADWLAADGVAGDLVIAAHVTYFVREIVPFIEKLRHAARRRVAILLGSPPPPTQQAVLFEAVFGEPELSPPSHEQLLPVLWSLGILPDVRVLDPLPTLVGNRPLATVDDAAQMALGALAVDPESAALRERVLQQIDTLFTHSADGYRPAWPRRIQQLLVTWQTAE